MRCRLLVSFFLLLCIGSPIAVSAQAGSTADPMVQDLLRAIQRGDIDEVRRLLDAGAPASEDALFLALNRPDLQLACLLLDRGADPNSEPTIMPGVGSSLAFYSGAGKLDAVQLLLDQGADPNRLSGEGRVSPLMTAAIQNRVEVAKALLAAGADPSVPVGSDGETAMEWAAAVGLLTGDTEMAQAMARGSSEGEELLRTLEGGMNIDGTNQKGSLTLDPGRATYPAGTFTGPCLSRRNPAMDPAHPQPGASGSGAYRETHVSFVGGMKVGMIAPPECEPLHLAPADYEVTVLGGDMTWVWVCSDSGEGRCPIVRKEETFTDLSDRFEVGVEPAPDDAEDEPSDDCRVESVKIVSPDQGYQVSYDRSATGILELRAEADPRPSDCDQELQWTMEDIGSVTATIETGGDAGANGAVFTFRSLPERNEDFGPKRITVTIGGKTDTLSVEVFFNPTEYNHPGSQGTPNWFYYWGQTLAGAGVDLEHRPSLTSETVPGAAVQGQYIFAEDQVYLSDRAYRSSCTTRSASFGGEAMKGIDCVAELVRHETQHQVERREWWGSTDPKAARAGAEATCGIAMGICEAFQEYKNQMDYDLDLVPNWIEQQLADSRGCDWQDRKSCTGRPPGKIDLELNAYSVGWGWIKGGADREDWSWCGKQWVDASVCPGKKTW